MVVYQSEEVKRFCLGDAAIYLDERVEKTKADDDSLDEKENGVELMKTLVTRDGSNHQAGQEECGAHEIGRSEFQEMGQTFE